MLKIDKKITNKVDQLFIDYPTVNHELILRLKNIDFSHEELYEVAKRFYHIIYNFPRFIAAVIANWDDTIERMPLVENLFEEHGRMNKQKIHVKTYLDYLGEMGLDVNKIKDSAPTPATISYVRSVLNTCTQEKPIEALGVIGIIEDIVHRVSAVIGQTTKENKKEIEEVSHFGEHEVLDDQHSKEIYAMIKINSKEDEFLAMRGLTMGAFYHHQLYSHILQEVVALGTNKSVIPENIELNTQPKANSYPLQTGDAGLKRLDVLNKLYNPSTINKILPLLNKETESFLDFGCGFGQISSLMAKELPHLQVMGIDQDPKQIELCPAKEKNLSYQSISLSDLVEQKKTFDVIYTRWTLIYQKDLAEILASFKKLLNPKGILIIEDNDPKEPHLSYPDENKALEQWKIFWKQALTVIGQGPGLEKSLIDKLKTLGFNLINKEINQQVLQTPEEKSVFFWGIEESKEAILKAGYPEDKLNEFLNNLYQLKDEKYPINFVQNFILCFQK